MEIAPGLRACGDYVEGPYPATLEGAVRSGLNAVTYRFLGSEPKFAKPSASP
jgi:predicted NAD/FAD-dependent oxidoreductase